MGVPGSGPTPSKYRLNKTDDTVTALSQKEEKGGGEKVAEIIWRLFILGLQGGQVQNRRMWNLSTWGNDEREGP